MDVSTLSPLRALTVGERGAQIGVAIIGCGFVADYYVGTLRAYPNLRICGAYDRDPRRNDEFARYHQLRPYETYEAALADRDVEIIVNLTSPESHFDVSRAALAAGKHVYTEKPFALHLHEASALVDAARTAGRFISGAPCCVLGEGAQTMWKAMRAGAVGPVLLAYAEVEDGLLQRMPCERWRSASGAAWPVAEEVRLGCVLAHGSYAVSWLIALFGSVREVVGFATRVTAPTDIDSKLPIPAASQDGNHFGPDWGVASLTFDGGVVARVTCGRIGPRERAIEIFGSSGLLRVQDCSIDRSPVAYRRYMTLRRKLMLAPWPRRYPLLRSGRAPVRHGGAQRRDFARGIADLGDAIRSGREPRLSADFCLHTTEVVHAIHDCMREPGRRTMTTSCAPISPMPWAAD